MINQFYINLDKYSVSERNYIQSILSSFDDVQLNYFDKKIKSLVEKRTRGWANFFRRGISKIHRYKKPVLINYNKLYGTQKQPLLQMFHRFKKHNHQLNELLIQYRERNSMRLNIRTERQETYCALDLALLNFLDVDQFGIGLFEIKCSVEMLAKTIDIYRIDKNGHARYDTLLNAIHDYEKSKQIIIYRDFDKTSKTYKPMRMWLTPDFFKSRGYTEEELRNLLKSREHYLYKKSIFNKSREEYQTVYLQRLDKAGVLNPPDKLVKKLVRIKNLLLDMHYEKKSIKQSKKYNKQAQKELEEKNTKNTSYRDIFEYHLDDKLSVTEKYLIKQKVLNKRNTKTLDEQFWLDCLIESGFWSPS